MISLLIFVRGERLLKEEAGAKLKAPPLVEVADAWRGGGVGG